MGIKTQGTIISRSLGGSPDVFEAIGKITGFTGPQMSAPVIDDSTLDSTWAEKLIGIPDAGEFSVNINWDSTSGAQDRVREDFGNGTLRTYQVTLTSGKVWQFSAYVKGVSAAGGMNDKVTGQLSLEITGEPMGL